MAGIMDALFGPDGIGGQPGLVGKAGQAIWQGTGELGPNAGFGETLAKSLGNIPHFLTDIAIKNPLEILRNPASALNDRGEVSITRLLFPDFRRNAEKEQKQQQKLQDAATSAQVFNTYNNLVSKFTEAPQDQRGGVADMATQAGVPDQQIEQALAAANQQDQSRQQAIEAVTPAVAGVQGGPELVRMLFSQDPNQKAAGELLWKKQQEDARVRERQAAIAARQSARSTPKPSEGQKAVDEFRAAMASGDQLRIAVARAQLEKIGKSSQPMVVTSPDGQTVVGPASEVSGFESATARDRARAAVDSGNLLIAAIQDMRDLANRSPEAFGAAGMLQGFKQNLIEQSNALRSLSNRAQIDDKVDQETRNQMDGTFNIDIPNRISLEMTLAYAKARAQNPVGVISNQDFNQALREVRGQEGEGTPWLANAKSMKASLDVFQTAAERIIKQNRLRAKRGGGKTAIQEALDREQGVQPKAEPKKGKLKKKKPQEDGAKGDYMAGMPDFSKMSDEELRALSGQ